MMKIRVLIIFGSCLLLSQITSSQQLSTSKINKAADNKLVETIFNLRHFLRLQNDGNFPEQIAQNKQWCDSVFTALEFKTKTIKTEGAPLLFAEKKFHENAKNILFYLQIDGQPVDTTAWFQANPFEPVLKEKKEDDWTAIDFKNINEKVDPEWRIFARSASDSKGPAIALISALQILQSKKIKPEFNIKVIMDFQEELGSPDLPKAVEENRDLLQAEMLFIMDGTRHLSNLPTLTYGARGIATATIKVFGPKYGLHSGQYGNFAPNPVFEASKLIGGLKDENGRVSIPDFYEGVTLTEADKSRLALIPENIDGIKQYLGIARRDAVGGTYQEALQYPSLNVRGLKAAWTGKEVRTIIPSEVVIEIDMRLVPETSGKRQMSLLKNYILGKGYHIVDSIPSLAERKLHPKLASFSYRLGSLPFRTEMNSPIGTFLNKAMYRVFGDDVVNMRTTGGSQPMAPFIRTLNVPAVSIRIPNPDNSIHGPNENLRLGNLKEGIVSCLAILTEPL
ncbi:M20/M25/M40 family metallo-hydrolase [Maribacter sp. R77961]|uniref:M20/M25/M40 family metallo-hydrolase n=1 Tax=Maribacter sp. R77961 TaxID=3093871 RepID=UPI0037C79E6C